MPDRDDEQERQAAIARHPLNYLNSLTASTHNNDDGDQDR